MKKLIFGLVALSSLTFANGLFDFQDAKIISGTKFNTNAELVGKFDKTEMGTKKELKFAHEIKAQTVLYEFAKIEANVKYNYEKEFVKAETSSSSSSSMPKNGVTLDGSSSIGVEFNFKEYGRLLAKVEKANNFIVGYTNEVNPSEDLNANVEAHYILGYGERLKPMSDKNNASLSNKMDIKLGASYKVLEDVKVFGHGKADITFGKDVKFSPQLEAGVEVNKIVKSVTRVRYSSLLGSSGKEHSLGLSENVSYEFKDLAGINSFSVKPELDISSSFALAEDKRIDLNLTPKVSARYEIVKGLDANASIFGKVKFGSDKDYKNFNYKGVETGLNLGLTYTLN